MIGAIDKAKEIGKKLFSYVSDIDIVLLYGSIAKERGMMVKNLFV